MKKLNLVASIGAMVVVGAAHAQTVELSVKGPAMVKAGGKVTLQVTAKIPKGYHIYGPKVKTGIPTSIEVVGMPKAIVSFPATKKFDAISETIDVYEGNVVFPVSVTFAKKGVQNLKLVVKTQACNDRTCLIPKTTNLSFKLNVK